MSDNMLTIDGLTARQKLFAEILWECRGQDQVTNFVQSLPASFQQEARAVFSMIVAAAFDNIVSRDNECLLAQDVIKRVK